IKLSIERVFRLSSRRLIGKSRSEFDLLITLFYRFSHEWRAIRKGSFARCSVFKEQFLFRQRMLSYHKRHLDASFF
ncbi:hypothetical protein, partial [Paenibacillus sp. NEAU-GSW1]|uniref:hypothetical protein n=1 Tax=Paenibacillus sp. NEAU-GSW1 TaxID=2682486 RepID=UPI001C12C99C